MEVIISVLIAFLIFALVCWIISVIPLPESPFPIKVVLYVLAAVAMIIFLLRFI
jgi:hypothetical protein